MNKLAHLRKDYRANSLLEENMEAEPLDQFNNWMEEAVRSSLSEPNAMTVATATPDGKPSARVVLLKEVNRVGFVFYTNHLSRKGREMLENPFVAAVFDWHDIERQVRIEGRVELVSNEESDAYFNSRPESSKLGAWVSPQSKVIKNREELDRLQEFYENRFKGKPITRPDNWGGFLIRPMVIEFWQGRTGRLHDRIVYYKTEDGWTIHRLAP